jgi:outer membrane receptor for ferrienterochelin and colicin
MRLKLSGRFQVIFLILFTPCFLVAQDDDMDFSEMSLEDLLNVEVTAAGKKAQKINEIPASVVVISRNEIERQGYQTLNDILEHVPGLYGIDQRSVDGMKFGIRGFFSPTANGIIYLINGVRQERVGSDGAVYPAQRVPPKAIDRIEIIRGPMSILYGTGAFFGVINIVTNVPRNDENGIHTDLTIGNENTMAFLSRGEYKVDEETSFIFNAGYRNAGGAEEPYTRMSTFDLASDYGVRRDKTDYKERNIFFDVSGRTSNFYFDVNYDFMKFRSDLFFPATEEGALSKRTYLSMAVGYKKDVNDKFSIDAKATYHKGSVQSDWDWFVEPGELNLGGDINYREDAEFDLVAYFNPSDKFSLTAGAFYKRIFHEQIMTVAPLLDFIYRLGLKGPAISQAIYAQADYAASDKFQIVFGLRGDQSKEYDTYYRVFAAGEQTYLGKYTHDDIEILPRFAAIYKFSESNIFKFLYGKAINHPSDYQTANQGALGQPALDPEFIETFEINHLWASGKFSSSISVFFNELDKLIIVDIDDISGAFIGNNRNAGVIETTGVEWTLKAVPTEKFDMELSLTTQDSKDKSEDYSDFDVPYSPELLGYLKAHIQFTEGAGLGITGRYVDGMLPLYDLTVPGRIGAEVDSYFTLGLNLRFNLGSSFYGEVSASNVLEEEFNYPTGTINAGWANLGTIGDGRTVELSFGKRY